MKDGKLVVGLIGCGAFAEEQDVPNFLRNDRTRIKWCCDVSLERARKLAARCGATETTADFLAVIRDPEVDLIKVSTSHEVHLPIIEAAAARGVHVFCEKPMALRQDEAFKIIAAVRRGGIKLCVDLNRRMAPAMHALRAAWQAQRAAPQHHPWRPMVVQRAQLPEEKWAHLLVNIQDESSSYRMVHLDPLRGGGEIIGETVHWLDLVCWFYAPQIPVQIQAWGSRRLSHGINLKFSGGDSATILFNCGGTFDYPKEYYEIASDAALFQGLFFLENRYHGIPGKSHETFPLQADDFRAEVPEPGFDAYLRKYTLRRERGRGGALAVDKGHQRMLDGFVAAILENRPSPCDELAGYQATYLAQKAIESLQLGQALPIPVEEVTPCFV